MRALLALILLSGCAAEKASAIAEERYELVKRHGLPAQRCEAAYEVQAAYLEERDRDNYVLWTVIVASDCGVY